VLVFTEAEQQSVEPGLKTPAWVSIGFQSKNPRTDFRAGGILSLYALKYFAQSKPTLFGEMKQHANKSAKSWFLAIASINLASQLKTYLYLVIQDTPMNHLRLKASR